MSFGLGCFCGPASGTELFLLEMVADPAPETVEAARLSDDPASPPWMMPVWEIAMRPRSWVPREFARPEVAAKTSDPPSMWVSRACGSLGKTRGQTCPNGVARTWACHGRRLRRAFRGRLPAGARRPKLRSSAGGSRKRSSGIAVPFVNAMHVPFSPRRQSANVEKKAASLASCLGRTESRSEGGWRGVQLPSSARISRMAASNSARSRAWEGSSSSARLKSARARSKSSRERRGSGW